MALFVGIRLRLWHIVAFRAAEFPEELLGEHRLDERQLGLSVVPRSDEPLNERARKRVGGSGYLRRVPGRGVFARRSLARERPNAAVSEVDLPPYSMTPFGGKQPFSPPLFTTLPLVAAEVRPKPPTAALPEPNTETCYRLFDILLRVNAEES